MRTVRWRPSCRPCTSSRTAGWSPEWYEDYHDDAQLGDPTAEVDLEVLDDVVVPVAPGEGQEEPGGGSNKLSLGLLLADPCHGFGFALGEPAFHLL